MSMACEAAEETHLMAFEGSSASVAVWFVMLSYQVIVPFPLSLTTLQSPALAKQAKM